MATSNTFPTIQASILRSLVSVTRSTNELCKVDLGFHRVNDANVGQLIDAQNERLLQLVQRLLDAATGGQERLIGPQLADIEAIDGNWGEVVDGLFSWESSWPKVGDRNTADMNLDKTVANGARDRKKAYMIGMILLSSLRIDELTRKLQVSVCSSTRMPYAH